MFLFLSKFLPLFIYPVGLVLILLVLIYIFRRKPKMITWLTVICLAVVYLAGNRFISTKLVQSLEWQYLPAEEYPRADAIVVLGGSTEAYEPPRPWYEINGAGDRLIMAARLYHAGKAPIILVSGGLIEWAGDYRSTPAEEMSAILQLMGVPEQAIMIQSESRNTYEDALYSKAVLIENKLHSIILVTSAMHMPRAAAIFRKQQIQFTPAPADYIVTQQLLSDLLRPSMERFLVDSIPTSKNIHNTTNALKEYLGLLVYRIKGWL